VIHFEDIVETCLAYFGNDFDWEKSFEEVNALLDSAPPTDVGKWQPKLEHLPTITIFIFISPIHHRTQ